MMEEEISLSTFWDHLEELRWTLIKIIFVILVGAAASFAFHTPIIQYLKKPLDNLQQSANSLLKTYEIKTHRIYNQGDQPQTFTLPPNSRLKSKSQNVSLLNTTNYQIEPKNYIDFEQEESRSLLLILDPIEGFASVLKISLWIGFAVTSPIWLYFVFQFITPALHQKEKSIILPFIGLSILFITLGVFFSLKITLPLANHYLFAFNESLGLNFWSFSSYVDYTFLLLLSNAVAFELFAVVFLLVHFDLIKAEQMKNKRKHVCVTTFILGALLTPPDVLSQLLLALPLILLYEMTILYATFRKAQKRT